MKQWDFCEVIVTYSDWEKRLIWGMIGLQVGWIKADTKAIQAIHDNVITHNPRVSVSSNDLSTWNLHIKAVTEEDRGNYMCQINTDPMKSQVSLLNISRRIFPEYIIEHFQIRFVIDINLKLKMWSNGNRARKKIS